MPTIPRSTEEGIARHAVSPDSKIKSVSLSIFVKKELYKLIILFLKNYMYVLPVTQTLTSPFL